MSKPNVIKIDEVEYIRADAIPMTPSKKRIVVLQRGWVVVGDVREEDNHVYISNASVIRVWGTTKGLGEIASSGPTKDTKLDKCPDVKVHQLTVVMMMNVDGGNW